MKKLLTLLLTAALATTAATTAFAADNTITPGADGNPTPTAKPEMTVTYTVQPTYTVTIPASVTMLRTAIVRAGDVTLPKGQAVKVKLTDAKGFKVKSQEGAELSYAVFQETVNGSEPVKLNDTVLSVASDAKDNTGEALLTFAFANKATYSGTYTGTLTFTVSVEQTGGNN